MIPHTAFTLNTVCLSQRTHTGMSAQTLPAVAHPGFAEVTYCPLMEDKYSVKFIFQQLAKAFTPSVSPISQRFCYMLTGFKFKKSHIHKTFQLGNLDQSLN